MEEMISVILPIYNMQDYIAECLESVIKQTYRNIEIICVNDFSMDNSMTIVKQYAEEDERIHIVHNEKNRGLGGARNAGLDIARGEYIIFVDTDDKMMPNMVEQLYHHIMENGSDMAFCDVMLLGNDGLCRPCKPFHDNTLISNRVFYPKKQAWAFTNMWPSAWNKIYKKSIIDSGHIRFHENILYEDHTFYYEYLFSSEKVSYLPKALYIYRHERAGSIMKEASPRIFEIFTILGYINNILKNNLDEKLYKILMPKISVRLVWERLVNLKRSKIKREFTRRAQNYLRQFKQKDIFLYKDYFIGDEYDFLYTPLQLFMQKIISIKHLGDYDLITILGIKFRRRNYLRGVFTRLDIMQQQINYLSMAKDEE